jgi:hypothetical protein
VRAHKAAKAAATLCGMGNVCVNCRVDKHVPVTPGVSCPSMLVLWDKG